MEIIKHLNPRKRKTMICLFFFTLFFLSGINLEAQTYVEIPLGGNSFVTAGTTGTVSNTEWSNWKNTQTVFSTYFKVNQAGVLNLYLKYTSDAEGNVIEAKCKGQTFNVTLPKSTSARTIKLGTINNCPVGYVQVDIKGITLKGTAFAKPTHLSINGTASSGVNFVPSTNLYFGRRGPSVHMNYTIPAGKTIEWFYNEVTIPVGMDPVGTYSMANGFSGGYFGMQVNSTAERRILFSVWSPYETDDPNLIPESKKVKLVKKGEGVYAGEFGNEGAGGQSYLKYMWKAGNTYKFLNRIRPSANGYSEFTAYFYAPEEGKWRLIAQFLRPEIQTYYKSPHSFLESFSPNNGYIQRKSLYKNQWARTKEGQWIELTQGTFTNDATGNRKERMDFKGGLQDGGFFLENCGFFNDYVTAYTKFSRPATNKAPDVDVNALEKDDNTTVTPPPGGGNESCNDVPAWVSSKSYNGGDKVYYNGYIYTAAYWTQNNRPDQNYGAHGKPWKDNRVACSNTSNTPPDISISSPSHEATVNSASILVSVNANDADGSIAKVEFYLNNELKQIVNVAPFSATIGDLRTGANTIKTKAFDDKGATAESTISVNHASVVNNAPPTISITDPANNSAANAPSVNVTVEATDADGSISKVEFYLNGTLKHTTTSAPYKALSLGILNSGSNTIMAKAYDNKGTTSESSIKINYPTSINNIPPMVSISAPANGSSTEKSSVNVTANVSDQDGSISKAEFYLNDELKQIINSAPYTTSVGTLKLGFNTIKVKAFDNKDAATESSVSISYSVPIENAEPTVSISSPANTSTVNTTSIHVTANANDVDGSISKVEFYLNGVLKHTATSTPYSTTLSTLNAGSNAILVKAYDNKNASATANISVTYSNPNSNDDCMSVAEWSSSKVYNSGDQVKDGDVIYKANYWTQNNRPSQNFGSGKQWSVVSKCDGTIDTDAFGEVVVCSGVKILIWKKESTYDKPGTQVVYEGKIYSCSYWTKGNVPSSGGAWKLVGTCK